MSAPDLSALLRRLGLSDLNAGAWSGAGGWSKTQDTTVVSVRNPADGSLHCTVPPRKQRRL